ncbi:phosphate acetyltransferase [Rhodohalobacter sp. 8-1]|uniref:phosphate acetyltransferase n=1 Tax=Rhodohalobacter sp. 8-1 TaxID=3131972 RepID=UPI0030ECF31D
MKKSILQTILKRSIDLRRKIVFPEAGRDPRVLHAVMDLYKANVVQPVLVSLDQNIEKLADTEDIDLPESIPVIHTEDEDEQKRRISFFEEKLSHKNPSQQEILRLAKDPLMTAGWLVATGKAEGAVAGSIASTADVIRASLRTIGTAEGAKLVSSTFLMEFRNDDVVTYADCGVVPYPDAEQLADIAVTSGQTHKILTGEDPKIAFLSFSTKGSASHERVELVKNALQIAQDRKKDWQMDGELQFDSAFVPEVGKRKAPDSKVAGNANVYIFPNLDAGNIAYKITERVGGATAIGPILQGLAKPYMDLSRGCSQDDIFYAAAICSVLSNA